MILCKVLYWLACCCNVMLMFLIYDEWLVCVAYTMVGGGGSSCNNNNNSSSGQRRTTLMHVLLLNLIFCCRAKYDSMYSIYLPQYHGSIVRLAQYYCYSHSSSSSSGGGGVGPLTEYGALKHLTNYDSHIIYYFAMGQNILIYYKWLYVFWFYS